MFNTLKRLLVGRPLATSEQEHQRISKTIALAVFSSDAISSTAYATQQILFVIAVGGSSLALGLSKLVPIAIAVVDAARRSSTTSYRQTIFAYPSGGGSYIVSRENLGENPALIAGASLMVDYILTVAVSVSAGVAAIVSIPQFEGLAKHRVAVCLVDHRDHHARQPARHQGVGPALRVPDLRVHLHRHRAGVPRAHARREFGWFGGIHPIPFDSQQGAAGPEASSAAR